MAFLEFELNKSLAHYTSFEGFLGILESKRFWFSDLRKTNDPREIAFGLERMHRVASRVSDKLDGHAHRQDFVELFERSISTLDKLKIYSLCLSQRIDYLPLWRLYCQEGEGVCIILRSRAIRDFPCRVQKVLYLEENEEEAALADIIFSHILKLEKTRGFELLLPRIEFGTAVLSSCVGVKHSNWDYEHEVRCVYTQVPEKSWLENALPVSETKEGEAIGFQEPLLRKSGLGDVNYLPMPFGKFSNGKHNPFGAIETVILGPRSKASIPEISSLMTNLGYFGFSILKSNCAWRD